MVKKMLFRSRSRRERAMGHAEHVVHLGREGGQSLQRAVPVAQHRLEELREQALGVIRQIEDMREQVQPVIEEGKKSVDDGKKSAAHGASAVALASQISRKRSRGKFPLFLVVSLVVGGAVCIWWKRRDDQRDDAASPEALASRRAP